MIIPQPEADLSLNIMVVGADIIKILIKSKDDMTVDTLIKNFFLKDNRRTHQLFFDTITFLYILDIVEENNNIIKVKHGYTQKNLFQY
ncbi:MAG: hypothetical protein Q8N08_04125 [Methanobacteriaceae archaeon]|nr:hypothetical protein [Methanobacteriaceae archaeon]